MVSRPMQGTLPNFPALFVQSIYEPEAQATDLARFTVACASGSFWLRRRNRPFGRVHRLTPGLGGRRIGLHAERHMLVAHIRQLRMDLLVGAAEPQAEDDADEHHADDAAERADD